MMWHWWSWGPGPGYGWAMTLVGILLFLVGVFALAGYVVKSRTGTVDAAMETLRRRLAAGDITSEEFERLRKLLRD